MGDKFTISNTANLTGVGQALTPVLGGASDVTFHITGVFVGTIAFEATIDGTNWAAVSARDAATTADATRVVSATAVGLFVIDAGSFSLVRARCSAYTSGTAVVKAITAVR